MCERCRIAPPKGVAIVARSTCRRDKQNGKRENHNAKNNPGDGADGSDRMPGRLRARLDGPEKFNTADGPGPGGLRTMCAGPEKSNTADGPGAGRSSPAAGRRCSQREKSQRSERSAEQG